MSWTRTADTLSSGEAIVYEQFGIDTDVILNSNLTDNDLSSYPGVSYGPVKLNVALKSMSAI